MARCFQQPVHNGLSEAFRGKSLGIDLCHTFIIEFSHLVYIQSHIPSKEDLLI